MYFPRSITSPITKHLNSGKVILVFGPRRAGKTTLLKHLREKLKLETRWINAEDARFYDILSTRRTDRLAGMLGKAELLIIDEAQRVPEVGDSLKLMIDSFPKLKIIASGSSSLDLARRVGEPLTGRSWTFQLLPISFVEYAADTSRFEADQQLENFLRFGSYPEVVKTVSEDEKIAYLNELTNSYLYKDILEMGLVQRPPALRKLLELIAFQIGSEVSLKEIGSQVGLDRATVERYLGLLEESFVLFRLGGFNRNLRKEISKSSKYYFWDLGIRNALIGRYESLSKRDDVGALWENFCIAERRKSITQPGVHYHDYFWRLHSGAEIDYIESADQLVGTEFKWSDKKAIKTRAPGSWSNTYPEAEFKVVSPDNFGDWLLSD